MNRALKASVWFAAALVLFGSTAWADAKQLTRVEQAIDVLDAIVRIPEQGIPTKLLRNAAGIVVVPNVVKAGFVVGGRHGKGLLSVRAPDGAWTNPSFVSLTGGSFGFQAGVQSTDVVLVFKTQRGVDGIVNGKCTLGGDASVAAGPVGRNAQAATDGQLTAEIYAYSRSRGLFAGVALDGSVLAIDHKSNEQVYGRGTTPRKIFGGDLDWVPDQIVSFRDLIEEQMARQVAARPGN